MNRLAGLFLCFVIFPCASFAAECVVQDSALPGDLENSPLHVSVVCENESAIINIKTETLALRPTTPVVSLLRSFTSVKSVTIEARRLAFFAPLSLPGTDVVLRTSVLVFGEKGQLDVTPSSSRAWAPMPVDVQLYRPANGADGRPGSTLRVEAEEIVVRGKGARLIANGGRGQDAGEGLDGEKVRLFSGDSRSTLMTAINNSSLGIAFANDLGTLIGIGPHFSDCAADTGVCAPRDASETQPGAAEGSLSWPSANRDAIAGGLPGAGGAGGKIYLRVAAIQNVPGWLTSVSPGVNGKADRNRVGQKALTSSFVTLITYPDGRTPIREVRAQVDGKDAVGPSPILPPAAFGKIYRH